MTQLAHRIRRQRWIVRTDSAAAGFELRRQVRADWQQVLLGSFERAFDRLANPQEIIHIPSIALHFKLSGDTSELSADVIDRQFAEQLGELRRAQPGHHDEPARWKMSSTPQARAEALLHYLRTGALPWEWAQHGSAATWPETCRQEGQTLQEVAVNEPPAPAFFFRWFQLLPGPEAAQVVRSLLAGAGQPWIAPWLELLSALLESGESYLRRHCQLELVSACLSEALACQQKGTAPDLAGLLEGHPWLRQNSATLVSFLDSHTPGLPAVLLSRDSFSHSEREGSTGSTSPRPATRPEGPGLSPPGSPHALATSVSPPLCSAKQKADFPLLVNHAGLVLLHPFLPRFFETTGLRAKDERQLPNLALARAAALLFFLATGQEDIREYDLALIKLLLGLSPADPLCVAEGLISASDREACEGLLQAIIGHWPALKRTSVAGLRSAFLERQGLLQQEEHGWTLQIERLSYDVLRDRLPWGLSVVKLPWMEQPIYTEW